MRNPFHGFIAGDRCTCTVYAFGLQSRVLLERGVIMLSEDGRDYLYCGGDDR